MEIVLFTDARMWGGVRGAGHWGGGEVIRAAVLLTTNEKGGRSTTPLHPSFIKPQRSKGGEGGIANTPKKPLAKPRKTKLTTGKSTRGLKKKGGGGYRSKADFSTGLGKPENKIAALMNRIIHTDIEGMYVGKSEGPR